MTQRFFLVDLKCPKCEVFQQYHDMPDIVCDYCCADIKINGEMVLN